MANSLSHSLPYPVKHARFTLPLSFRVSAGTPTDPTTPDTEFSSDGGATFGDCAEEITTGGANGMGYLTLTGAETNNSVVLIAAKSANCLTTPAVLFPRVLPILETGTAQAGASGTITLTSGAAAYDLSGCIVRTTGGTGGGGTGGANNQARVITAYNVSTKVATIEPNWETTPSSDTTYDILFTEMACNALKSNTTSLLGTAVATPATAGIPDVNVKNINNVAAATPGASGGILISGSNSGTTTLGALTVSGATTLTGAVSLGSTLGVTGTTTLAAVTTTGTVTMNALTVSNATTLTGAVSLGSTLGVTGTTTLAALTTTGTATLNALTVSNATTLTGAVSLGSTLGITGTTTLAALTTTGTMTVNAFTCTNNFTVSGNWLTTGTTTWTGAATFTNGLTSNITGNLSGSVGSVTGNVVGTLGNLASGAKTDVENAVWNAVMSSHVTALSTGASLNAAGSAGDPWSTAVPGAYGAGTAGFILGTNLDATVSSRLPTASYTAPPSAASVATAVNTTQLTESYAADGVAPTLAQFQFMQWSALAEFAIAATTITARKLDGSTTAMTFTLDSATDPTSRTRAT